MKKIIYQLLFCLLFTYQISFTESIFKKFLSEPASLPGIIKKKIAELEISADANFLSLNAFEGIGLAANYKYAVEPSYNKGFYTRVDKWKLKTSLLPGDILQNVLNFPLAFGLESEREILFVRQFKDSIEALKAKPYFLKHLPLSSEKALALNPGDFVSIPAQLNLFVEGRLSMMPTLIEASLSTHYLISGEFTIQVIRMPDSKVRLRVMSSLRKEIQKIGGELGLHFKIFGFTIINKKIDAIARLDLASFKVTSESGQLYMSDYILDLSQPECAAAYDSIVKEVYKFKSAKILRDYVLRRSVQEQVVHDFSTIENLAKSDIMKRNPRVQKVFKGLNNFKQSTEKFKIGLGFFNYTGGSTYTENQITSYSLLNHPTRYLFTNFTQSYDRRIIGFGRQSIVDSASALFLMDKQENILGIKDINFGHYLRDMKHTPKEFKKLKNYLKQNLPASIYQNLDQKMGLRKEAIKRLFFNFQVYFHRKAFFSLANLDKESLSIEFENYVQKNNYRKKLTYGYNLKRLLNDLQSVFSSNNFKTSLQNQIKQAMKLKDNELFNDIGLGFLLSLLDQDKLDEYIHVVIHSRAISENGFDFHWGSVKNSKLYKHLHYMQSLMNERTLEIRSGEDELIAESTDLSKSALNAKEKIFHKLYSK
ncbi:MAG: hypothetical protein COB02_16650 [Candidatus Cloacimonadota bacterium]|nr:MAG: hypothetical protein COB02_16650 [Candidatus Cloacimonadota bacterium]